ncbi:polysaccharide pyruvyl transferase family protein [Bhargavaea ullalensis]|uniref:Polysaccharide pyruvyl transferase CsaB n=1 Tax=Bhargavaea ullalensis TaxID=1265685 RepID=A0ABV2GB70_9BACL
MRIGIVGNYGNNNNGDEAILAGIIEQVKDHYGIGPDSITVFSNNPPQTSHRFGVKAAPLYYKRSSATMTFMETVKKNSPLIRELDLLIIGGGGILMDFYNREAQLFGSYGFMAKWGKVPYVIYACGAGPINSAVGKWFIRKLVSGASSASVRDPESKKLLQSIGVSRPIEIIGDPSFALPSGERQEFGESIRKIGVTVVPYYSLAYWPEANDIKYDNYVQGMADNLDRLLEGRDLLLTFFSTKYPHDVDVSVEVRNRMKQKDKTVVIEENLKPADIIRISGEQDLIIGTRLHSVYLALNAGTPVVGIAYHHKVADFMDMAGMGGRCHKIDALTKDAGILERAVTELEQDWSSVVRETGELRQRLKTSSDLGRKQFIPIAAGEKAR